jgi:hypothetical protein
MKNSHLLLAGLLLLSSLSFPLWGQAADAPATSTVAPHVSATIDPAKAAEIRKMLELTGMTKLVNQMKTQILDMYKSRNTGVSPEMWNRLDQEMDMNDLIEQIVPLYNKYYSLDDLKAANAFYQSPAGQRILAVTPQLMHASMQIGQAWGQKVGMKVEKEIEDEKAAAKSGASKA